MPPPATIAAVGAALESRLNQALASPGDPSPRAALLVSEQLRRLNPDDAILAILLSGVALSHARRSAPDAPHALELHYLLIPCAPDAAAESGLLDRALHAILESPVITAPAADPVDLILSTFDPQLHAALFTALRLSPRPLLALLVRTHAPTDTPRGFAPRSSP